MEKFIKAITDYYGTPRGHLVHINPDYIIKIELMSEREEFVDHYVITVDLGNKTELLHITLEDGNKLLND